MLFDRLGLIHRVDLISCGQKRKIVRQSFFYCPFPNFSYHKIIMSEELRKTLMNQFQELRKNAAGNPLDIQLLTNLEGAFCWFLSKDKIPLKT
jgi:hypothetical protein